MRPNELNALFASLQALTGIGPRLIVLLKKCLALPPGVVEPRVLDLLWHLPNGVIDRRAEPTVAEAVPGSIATLKVRVLKHKAPPRGNTRAPYKVADRGRHRPPRSGVFPRRAQVHRAPAPRGRGALRVGPRRALRRDAADVASRLHRGPGPARRAADAGAGLSAYRGPLRQDHAEGLTPGARSPARGPRVAGAAMAQGARLAGLRRGAAAPAPADRCSRRVAGRAALATARLRRAACGPARARARAHELQGPARPQRQGRRTHPRGDRRRAPLLADALAARGRARDRGRYGSAAAHAAAAAGRRRLGQDGRRPARHGGRGRSRRAGRAHGAHGSARAPAHGDDCAARREGRVAHCPAHGAREGALAQGPTRSPRRGRDRHPHRHARAVPVGRGVPRPRLRRHRRAAPLRRAPAAVAAVEGQRRRHRRARHDGDADPAHASDDALRRSRRVAAEGEAARPQAGRYQGYSCRIPWRS